jgi:hypothetical protein
MLLSAVMCAKPLRHRNVNIKLYINQIYANTIIYQEFTLRKSQMVLLFSLLRMSLI